MIYFDNAATSGHKPQSVINAVDSALRYLSANPGRSGHKASVKASMAVYSAREKLADMFGASGAENVVFTLNCTHSLNVIIKGLLNSGEHVVVSSLEHNAVMRPLKKINANITVANVSLYDDEITVREFEEKIKANTKLVICTGASNVLGKILPIGRIGAICKERGVAFAVDAAQTAGVIPIDMKEMNIDYLCIAAHKGLYAPMGVGVLLCNGNELETLIEGGTGTNSLDYSQPRELPERHESGTVALPAIVGLSAGVDFIKNRGVQRAYKYEMELMRTLYDGIRKIPDIKLYTPRPLNYFYAPVLSFNKGKKTSEDVAMALSEKGIAVRGGFHCAPSAHKQIGTERTGAVRVSLSLFNTRNEIDYFLNVLSSKKI